ncbi:dicarboxylate/amino acid:cation symporter [Peribacillus cavernae]|uniref:Dicarboxylate/amino acid:cation symporter n=1 Tax=Peribacillus cavernae TaxID=1674310 RepID=A0A433HWK9_9BACI|nr:dicarboxylate/amino acid:cation symporter [Peribacillus cavernae]MDQ0218177.1 Na+/H+-dicarboxylate symporter [Peribacillus cavernae]RUQ32677.1 dicarboxylate/amino acid:cation symporter [Peribacillus cavernae]
MKLSTKILVGLLLGILFGALLNKVFPELVDPMDRYVLSPVGEAFIRIIQFIVVPVVFTSLIIGLTSLQGTGKIGRYAGKLIPLYIATSCMALAIGMFMAVVLEPGKGVSISETGETPGKVEKNQSLIDWLVSIVPTNPFEALSTANLLQVIISAIIIGVAMNLVKEKTKPFLALIESFYAIIEKVLEIILKAAPIGVFALIASVIATQGFDTVIKLLWYVLGLIAAILLMAVFYYLFLLVVKAKPNHFFISFLPAFSLAFGTASSNAALPVAMDNAQNNYGMKRDITSFALPFGTAVKRDGAGILQGFNALFIAQLFDVPITASLIIAIFVSALLVSFSTAGVPGAGIIMMTTVLSAAGLPLEGVAIVAGVDRLTDGFRTALNMVGNTANAAIVNKWERS